MYDQQAVWIGSGGDKHYTLRLEQANRHGLIVGATGTGKIVTLKVMAEPFSDAGTSVSLADVKRDLAGMCRPGEGSADMQTRIVYFGLQEAGFRHRAYLTEFWDTLGKQGFPLRTMVSEFGLPLFVRLLDLNKIQSDLFEITFRIADEGGLLFLDMKDLKPMVCYVKENADAYRGQYGNIGKSSAGAVFRVLVAPEGKGGAQFFDEPALQISDWACVGIDGRGYVNILDLTSLIQDLTICLTFVLWMLNELFTELPEVGNLEKPRVVFFFDETHFLFDNVPEALLDKVEQVVKLIRSKGIGVYFIAQNPSDIPGDVLMQLDNRVRHTLRAHTPTEQKGVKAAAESLREDLIFDMATAFQELKTAGTLVPFLGKGGAPEEVRIASTLPPQSKFGALDAIIRQATILASSLRDKHAEEVDRELVYELLLQRVDEQAATAAKTKEEMEAEKQAAKEAATAEKQAAKEVAAVEKQAAKEAAAATKRAEKETAAATWEEKKKTVRQKRIFASIGDSVTGTTGREVGGQLRKNADSSFDKQPGGSVKASLGCGILKIFLKF